MNKKYYLLFAMLAGVALIARLQKASEIQTGSTPAIPKSSVSPGPRSNGLAPLPVTASTHVENEKPVSAAVTNRFAAQLRDLGDCLQIKNALHGEQEPTLENLNASVRAEVGDLVEQADDWVNTHVRLSNGEERRLRIEVEGAGEESSVKQLTYYGVDNENLPVRLPLPADQSKNPSTTFIASLEKEGTVFLREKGVRGIYAQGAEIYYTEKNGKLTELELTYNKKTFRCSSLDNELGFCRCF